MSSSLPPPAVILSAMPLGTRNLPTLNFHDKRSRVFVECPRANDLQCCPDFDGVSLQLAQYFVSPVYPDDPDFSLGLR
ncbi:hypothetical protein [Thermococcus sp. Bubb.Bath]|uniref:hypothetical protein n=1 Tax=Thermococcus sp. Bubb.Bath TaxID=1638242 RepID=UPI001438D224|nr:hypothetical protein [Thermococcus sp. Bubb.Bath]